MSKVSSWQCSRKTRLSNETFYTPRSVIRQPETLSILGVLHILDTSKRWLSLNSDLRILNSRRFAKVVETKNSKVTSLAMFTEHATFSSEFSCTRRRHIPKIWKLLLFFLRRRSFKVSNERIDSNSRDSRPFSQLLDQKKLGAIFCRHDKWFFAED